jgi:hypothetical protein
MCLTGITAERTLLLPGTDLTRPTCENVPIVGDWTGRLIHNQGAVT